MALLHFSKPKNTLEAGGRSAAPIQSDAGEPEVTCPNCHRATPESRLWANHNVCSCGYHFRLSARHHIGLIIDPGSFRECFRNICGGDPLKFPGYAQKLEVARASSGEREAAICGTATVDGVRCALFAMESAFMMGSMGSAVGEKIASLFEYATAERLPVIGFTVSGGARMQEGLLSLMQMAKVSATVKRHSDTGLLYLAVLTNPTTGGVTASFAMEADIILAEPGAIVGFAGARVIKQTTLRPLPRDFQRAESLLEHGFIDALAPRSRQKTLISQLLAMHTGG